MIHVETNRASSGSITIYSIGGQAIWNKELPFKSSNDIGVDISEWTSGIYLVQVNLGSKEIRKKLIVTK